VADSKRDSTPGEEGTHESPFIVGELATDEADIGEYL